MRLFDPYTKRTFYVLRWSINLSKMHTNDNFFSTIQQYFYKFEKCVFCLITPWAICTFLEKITISTLNPLKLQIHSYIPLYICILHRLLSSNRMCSTLINNLECDIHKRRHNSLDPTAMVQPLEIYCSKIMQVFIS